MLIDDQSALIAALSSPEAFGLNPSQIITVKETNISDVFLTGEKAYKLNRGVKYPYVDYSTPEKRLAADLWQARLLQAVGREDDIAVQEDLVKLNHEVPREFPPRVQAAADALPSAPQHDAMAGREAVRAELRRLHELTQNADKLTREWN